MSGKNYNDFKAFSRDQAYWERNQLVAVLSRIYPSVIGRHDPKDKKWDKDWRNIIYIHIPVEQAVYGDMRNYTNFIVQPMQLSWHIHNSDLCWFSHLSKDKSIKWDGHTTEEKYERMRYLHIKKEKGNYPLKLWEEYKKSIKPIRTKMCTTSLFSRKTTCTPFQITQKPSYEGFMDWKLERLKEEGK